MTEKNIQIDDTKPTRRPDILRAKDIIPGAANQAGNGVGNADIPRFNLAEDIMAEHRRLTASRRKGPGGSVPADVSLPSKPRKPFLSRYGFSEGFNLNNDPVIADIVARDIEQFCRGLKA